MATAPTLPGVPGLVPQHDGASPPPPLRLSPRSSALERAPFVGTGRASHIFLVGLCQGSAKSVDDRRNRDQRSKHVHQQRQDRVRHGEKHVENDVEVDRHEPDMPASRGNSVTRAVIQLKNYIARNRDGSDSRGGVCEGRPRAPAVTDRHRLGGRFPFIRDRPCRTLAWPRLAPRTASEAAALPPRQKQNHEPRITPPARAACPIRSALPARVRAC